MRVLLTLCVCLLVVSAGCTSVMDSSDDPADRSPYGVEDPLESSIGIPLDELPLQGLEMMNASNVEPVLLEHDDGIGLNEFLSASDTRVMDANGSVLYEVSRTTASNAVRTEQLSNLSVNGTIEPVDHTLEGIESIERWTDWPNTTNRITYTNGSVQYSDEVDVSVSASPETVLEELARFEPDELDIHAVDGEPMYRIHATTPPDGSVFLTDRSYVLEVFVLEDGFIGHGSVAGFIDSDEMFDEDEIEQDVLALSHTYDVIGVGEGYSPDAPEWATTPPPDDPDELRGS